MQNHLSEMPGARPQSRQKPVALAAVWLLLLGTALNLSAQIPENIDQTYQARIPIGADALHLGGSSKVLYLLVMAEADQFDGWRHVRSEGQSTLTDTSGASVQFYPGTIRFRVTASTRKDLLDVPSYPVAAPADLNDFLLNLRFELKLFRGLTQRSIAPERIELIGVPEEVPYDERIYEVTFSLHEVPITDRCLLEIDSPSGARLTRFHLDLF